MCSSLQDVYLGYHSWHKKAHLTATKVRLSPKPRMMYYLLDTNAPGCDGNGGDAVPEGAHDLQRSKCAGAGVPHFHSLVVAAGHQHLVVRAVGYLPIKLIEE